MWGEYVGCHSGLSQSKYYYNWLPAFLRIMATIATGNMMTGLLEEARKLKEGQEVMWLAQEETSQKLT